MADEAKAPEQETPEQKVVPFPVLPIVIQLWMPIKRTREITELSIHRVPNGADMLAVEGMGNTSATELMLQRLCALTAEEVKDMAAKDIRTFSDTIDPFL